MSSSLRQQQTTTRLKYSKTYICVRVKLCIVVAASDWRTTLLIPTCHIKHKNCASFRPILLFQTKHAAITVAIVFLHDGCNGLLPIQTPDRIPHK